jgi:hypothetical protein
MDRDHGGLQRLDPSAEPGWQHLFELGECADRGFCHPGHGAARGGPQPDRDRHGLVVVEQQRRQRRSDAEPVAASGAAGGIHWIAKLAKALDVVAHGSAADLQSSRQLLAGPFTAALEQRQEAEQSRRGRLHAGQRSLEVGAIGS